MPFAVTIHEKGGQPRRQEFDKTEVTIGRVQGNDIILPKQNVSKRHSRIVVKDGKFIIVDLKSTNGTYVNGRKIASPMVIKETDKIYIGDFILSAEPSANAAEAAAPPEAPPKSPPPPPRRPAPAAQRPSAAPQQSPASAAPKPRTPRPAPAAAPAAAPVQAPAPAPAPAAANRVRSEQAPVAAIPPAAASSAASQPAVNLNVSADEAPAAAFRWMQHYMASNRMSAPVAFNLETGADKSLTETLVSAATPALQAISGIDPTAVAERAAAEAVGAGALGELLGDSSIERIYFNGLEAVWITRGGVTSQSSASFSCADAADLAARRVLGARDVCLFRHGYIADGSRVHFVSAHAGGPYITVDRPSKGKLTLKQVADQGCMSANMATYLAAAVQHGRTIVVNSNDIDARFEFISALLGELTPTTRAICVDTGGRLAAPNTCSVILTAPGGQSTLSQALLMRPDYLVVADVTTTDPLQAVTAMSATTGGGILGVTADSPEDGLARLIRQSASHRSTQGEATGLGELCQDRIDIIVQVHRFGDGSLRVTQIMDVDGAIQEIYSGFDNFTATGQVPRWYENALGLGQELSNDIFA